MNSFLQNPPETFGRPAQVLSVYIHQNQEEIWQLTKAFNYDQLIVWIRSLFSSEIHQKDTDRLLQKLWRTSCKSNVWWVLDLLWELVESPRLHTRLIRRILNCCLRNSIQYSQELYRIILACMNQHRVSATVTAKMLYIAWLRFDVDPEHFKYIVKGNTVQMYSDKESVLKNVTRFLSPAMFYSLTFPRRRTSQFLQRLWKSRAIQGWVSENQAAIPIVERFLKKSVVTWRIFQRVATCCICLEIRKGSMKPLHADMRHVVCKACYSEMRQQQPHVGCPVCRRPI